eukprot:16320-Ditylum_brightwellii.AAC.1
MELLSADNLKIISEMVNFYQDFCDGKNSLPFKSVTLADVVSNMSQQELKRLSQMQMIDLNNKNQLYYCFMVSLYP